MDLTPIGFGASVTDADGRALEENALISAESAYTYMSERIRMSVLPIVAVERTYSVCSAGKGEHSLNCQHLAYGRERMPCAASGTIMSLRFPCRREKRSSWELPGTGGGFFFADGALAAVVLH
ncbi:MAG: hypothetical protein ACLVLH_19230 [Eisenbergiella massiliensis]